MRLLRQLCVLAAAGTISLATPAPAHGQDKAAFAKEVNEAVARGVEYLFKLQREDGTWPYHMTGATTLAAWTLLECGVSPNDPRLTKAANVIRQHALEADQTYEVSLAILFFDKLGDPADAPLIEALALQLLAGQGQGYGWIYRVPTLPKTEILRLQKYVAKLKADGPRKLPEKPPEDKKPRDPKQVNPTIMALALATVRARPWVVPPKAYWEGDDGDNSNTQFAMLALWVARRYGLPVDRALLGTEIRFRSTQLESGGWSYRTPSIDPKVPLAMRNNHTNSTMAACGLISLALGNGCVPPKAPKGDLDKDEKVKKALFVLSASIGEAGQAKEDLFLGNAAKSYYYLWTLERMAVIYGFKTIGGKDWYQWGAQLLLANQEKDGSWPRGEYAQGGIDTCFALLFLKKANVAKDLAAKVDKVKDPGKIPAELLDLIGREVKPSIEMKQKETPKNNPQQEPCPVPQPGIPHVMYQESFPDLAGISCGFKRAVSG